MRKKSRLCLIGMLFFVACSPRDFLTRRLAADLIGSSDAFKAPQQFVLQTGIVSNENYASPELLVLQHKGWISAANASCPQGMAPPPCWEVLLTPSGVETIQALLPGQETAKSTYALPVAKRELVAVTGIGRRGGSADVEFTWRWAPLNEIGAALYSADLRYKSTVTFREYDDGWRVVQNAPQSTQTLDDALKNAEPVP